MLAYASKEVLSALNEARSADLDTSVRFDQLGEAMKAGKQPGADGSESAEQVYHERVRQAYTALFTSHKRDSALIDLIRTELRWPR